MARIASARSRSRSDCGEGLVSADPLGPAGNDLSDRSGEGFHKMVDMLLVCTEAQDADASEKPVAGRATGQHHAAPLRRAFEQRARAVVLLRARRAGPGDVKSKERELRRRVDHDMRESGDPAPR